MADIKNEIRKILKKPPTKKVKCGCNGRSVIVGREPDGPNNSDWGNPIYGRCSDCDSNNMITVENTEKMIKEIIKVCKGNI